MTRKGKWKKGGTRQSPAVKIDVQYWRKDRRNKWRLENEELTETEFCRMFGHEQAGFFRGARVTRHSKASKLAA